MLEGRVRHRAERRLLRVLRAAVRAGVPRASLRGPERLQLGCAPEVTVWSARRGPHGVHARYYRYSAAVCKSVFFTCAKALFYGESILPLHAAACTAGPDRPPAPHTGHTDNTQQQTRHTKKRATRPLARAAPDPRGTLCAPRLLTYYLLTGRAPVPCVSPRAARDYFLPRFPDRTSGRGP